MRIHVLADRQSWEQLKPAPSVFTHKNKAKTKEIVWISFNEFRIIWLHITIKVIVLNESDNYIEQPQFTIYYIKFIGGFGFVR
jgi:hypothetical protein